MEAQDVCSSYNLIIRIFSEPVTKLYHSIFHFLTKKSFILIILIFLYYCLLNVLHIVRNHINILLNLSGIGIDSPQKA